MNIVWSRSSGKWKSQLRRVAKRHHSRWLHWKWFFFFFICESYLNTIVNYSSLTKSFPLLMLSLSCTAVYVLHLFGLFICLLVFFFVFLLVHRKVSPYFPSSTLYASANGIFKCCVYYYTCLFNFLLLLLLVDCVKYDCRINKWLK